MNRKQFIKLIILVSITFLFSLIVAIKTQQIAINIVNSLSAILPLVFGFSLAIVIYLITLSDSISSKIQSISIDQESTKIKLAVSALKSLNQEGLSNLILLFVLLLIVLISGDYSNYSSLTSLQLIIFSTKSSSILLMVYVTLQQVIALHTAMEFREILESHSVK